MAALDEEEEGVVEMVEEEMEGGDCKSRSSRTDDFSFESLDLGLEWASFDEGYRVVEGRAGFEEVLGSEVPESEETFELNFCIVSCGLLASLFSLRLIILTLTASAIETGCLFGRRCSSGGGLAKM